MIKNENWIEEDEMLLYQMRQEGIPYKIIAVELKRSVWACRAKYTGTVWESKSFYDTTKNKLKDNMKNAVSNQMNEARAKAIDISHMKTDIIVDAIVESVKALPVVKREVYLKNRSFRTYKHSPEDVGLIISDCHIGQEYTFEESS